MAISLLVIGPMLEGFGLKNGAFLFDVLAHDMPEADDELAGIARAVRLMTRSEAAGADLPAAMALVQQVPLLPSPIGQAIVDGIAAGWPTDAAPTLGEVERLALNSSRRASSGELEGSFAELDERWELAQD